MGWTPVQVRSGRQRRLVEPCRRCPCWHWKSTLLPTCPHTDSRKKPKSQYRSPADANANRLQALNLKSSEKRPLSAKLWFLFPFFERFLLMIICSVWRQMETVSGGDGPCLCFQLMRTHESTAADFLMKTQSQTVFCSLKEKKMTYFHPPSQLTV